MNKTKRNIQLIIGIFSFLIGIGVTIWLAIAGTNVAGMIVSAVVVASVVFLGIVVCSSPFKNGKPNFKKVPMIILVVLEVLTVVISIVATYGQTFAFVEYAVPLFVIINIALLIVFLCLPNYKSNKKESLDDATKKSLLSTANILKLRFQLVSGILAIVLGAVYMVGVIVLFATLSQYIGWITDNGLIVALGVVQMLLASACVVFGAIVCLPPFKDGKLTYRKGATITLLVLCSVLLFLSLVSVIGNNADALDIVLMIVTMIAEGLLITFFCLPDTKQFQQTTDKVCANAPVKATQTVEEKIAFLKALKADGTITEAEYSKRLAQVLDNL